MLLVKRSTASLQLQRQAKVNSRDPADMTAIKLSQPEL
jgi:hypothetical protein